MASATARPTFSFHHLPTLHPPKLSKTHLSIPPKPIFLSVRKLQILPHPFSPSSVDVSKEDKPLSQPEGPSSPESPPIPIENPPLQVPKNIDQAEEKLSRRLLEEQFTVLNTGIYECRSCGHRYDEAAGDPSYPIPPGLDFGKLPEDWRCPTCGAAKTFFASKSVEIAGFAENQQFGLGGNTLTSGQKALLIYGSLLFAFLLFLSGYFLQ